MSDSSHQPSSDPVEYANQRENAAAVLLKELDERQESVLEELEQLNGDIEDLIESWRGRKEDVPDKEDPQAKNSEELTVQTEHS
ncbi:MAG: hypothetical protein CMJ76_14620 [Planctomycetaceae bacterium]|nr:hypothetical protein [Planctomycetaceae bacterium]|tara:strand:+ start:3533 stop:3784 length:252 start_codon:yes stop_codon:yes gene_type:complete